MIGIYAIINKVNGKYYIGQSKNILKRLREHEWLLEHNQDHCSYLQGAYNKYGKNQFTCRIICECPEDCLDEFERLEITKHDSMYYSNGYNLKDGGSDGYIHSPETRLKISLAKQGHTVSKETREAISKKNKGMKAWNKGIKQWAGRKHPMEGKHHSDVSKEKISKGLRLPIDNDKVIDLYENQGYTQKEIAKLFGCSVSTISRHINKYKPQL